MELTYYLYDPLTFAFTEAVEIAEGDIVPNNSSKWPPQDCEPGQQAYFNGHGWVKSWSLDEMTPSRIRSLQSAVAASVFKNKMAVLNAGIASDEVTTFDQQYAEARAFLDTNQRPVFLEALARARSEDLNDFALKVVDKAETYRVQKARILAQYQLEIKNIEASEDPKLTQELLQHPVAIMR